MAEPVHPKLIRFYQRLSNLENASSTLGRTLAAAVPMEIKTLAVIKAFELTFELSWKAMKDYLEYAGISASTPREVIKEGFKSGSIADGQAWMNLLDRRNRLVHVYDQAHATKVVAEIEASAIPLMALLLEDLRRKRVEGAP